MNTDLITAATTIVTGYVTRNLLDPDDVPVMVRKVADALATVGKIADDPVYVAMPQRAPAVPVEDSLADTYVVCLECGRTLTNLRRHLRAAHGLTPEQYRERWNLPGNYPIVAPAYSRRRREIARTELRKS